jgi:MFS family permease
VDVAPSSQLQQQQQRQQQQQQQQQVEQPQARHTSHGTFVVPRSPGASGARGEDEHAVPLSLLIVLNAFVGAYGLIQVSMFLLVLPRQCEVMFRGDQAVGLAALLGMAGVTQLVNPVAGLLSDRTASPFGRRRPFVVVGSVVAVAALCVLWYLSTNSVLVAAQDDLAAATAKGSAAALAAAGFTSRDDFDAALDATRALYVAAFVLLNVSLNVCFAAYSGLIPDFVPVEQLGEASGIMAVMNALGALVGVWLVGRCGVEPFSLFAFCVVLCCALTLVTVKEHPLARAPARLSCADVFRLYFEPLREPAFRAVWFSRLLYYMGISIQVFMQFFIRDVLHVSEAVAKEETALVSIVMLACASLVAVPCGLLSDRVGRRPLVYTSCTLMSWTYVGWSAVSDFDQILWLAALFGLANGCFVSVEFAIGCDTLPDKDEHAAQALGIWGIAAFLGTTLGPVLAGPVLFLTGTSDQPDVYTRSGYTCLLAIGAILVLGSALALRAVPEFPHGGRHADVTYRALASGDKLRADAASP